MPSLFLNAAKRQQLNDNEAHSFVKGSSKLSIHGYPSPTSAFKGLAGAYAKMF